MIIHTSVILQNCDYPLNITSFRSILVHLGANRTMLKTWSEFIFDHSYLCYSSILWSSDQHTFILQHFGPFGGKSDNVENLVGIHLWSFIPLLFFKTVAIHPAYLHSAAIWFIWGQIRQYWKFGRNSSLIIHTSIILQNCDHPLYINSFRSNLVHLGPNGTMLKIWLEFIFDHSYLRYSSILWPSTQHTFIPQHFGSFGVKSDNIENLVGIHLWSFIPPLFFKTVAIHPAYLHSAAIWFIWGQIRQCWKLGRNSSLIIHTSVILQNCDYPLSIPSFRSILFHLGSNRTMLKIWLEYIFSHSYLRYSSKLWSSTQHTFIPQQFGSFGAKSDNIENLVGIHLWSFIPSLLFKTVTIHSTYLHSAAFCFILGQIGQCWKFGRNSSLIIHTSVILQNCGHPLNIPSFCSILVHLLANPTMLKIWSEFVFEHSYLHYSSKPAINSTYLHSAAIWFIWSQIGQCWKFGGNSSMIIHTSIILQNCSYPLSIPSFCRILVVIRCHKRCLKLSSKFDQKIPKWTKKLWNESMLSRWAQFW